jgi:hypothetical protein
LSITLFERQQPSFCIRDQLTKDAFHFLFHRESEGDRIRRMR